MNGEPSSVATLELAEFPGHSGGRLYTVVEASKMLGLPTSWIYQRTRKDAIPFHKFGKYIRFTSSDLAEILAAYSRGPKKPAEASRGG
ncbi:MAG: helix-turn-helix domain-containing protein [Acidobacteria bacterium]|nr:helix-turn-helix domain-containing protein [Acidobacteriota bacterium]